MSLETPAPIDLARFARDELGLELFPNQIDVLERFQPPYRHLILQQGRRSGKSLLADVLALADIALRGYLHRPPYMRLGEKRIAAIVATRAQQAAEHIENLNLLIEKSPLLTSMVVHQTREAIFFNNNATIRIYPCSARVIRGGALSSAILDEFGHFEEVDQSNGAGDAILKAVRPAMIQFHKQGWLIVISTPLLEDTAFGRMVKQAESGRHPYQLYIHRSTGEMRPDLVAAGELEEERQLDPDAYVLEYEAQFGQGAHSYLNPEDVIGCQRTGRNILPPLDGVRYIGALDPGFSGDRFAMAIGHKDPSDGRVIIDGVWTWHRGGYELVLNEVQKLAQAYRLEDLTTDQYAVPAILEGLAKRNIPCRYIPWTSENKAAAFGRLKFATNNRTLEIPEDHALIDELIALWARPTPTGFTRIAARPGRHDDRAIVVASVVDRLSQPDEVVVIFAGDTESRDAGWWPTAVTPSLLN